MLSLRNRSDDFKSTLLQAIEHGFGLDAPTVNFNFTPLPGPQEAARDSQADELFFGGSAGPGKSYLLCGLALNYHRAIIFRTTYGQLTELSDNISYMLGQYGRFNSIHNIFRVLPTGGKIELGAVSMDKDLDKWKGKGHGYIGFDEIGEFPFFHYQFLTIWNRSTRPGQRVRIVCTGNPPTSDKGRWVITYWSPWLDKDYESRAGRPKAQPGELRWFVAKEGTPNPNQPEAHFDEVDGPEPVLRNGEWVTPRSRTFIPAFLSDNPMFDNTGYRARLQMLPPALRAAYLDGRFDLDLEEPDHPFQVIPGQWVRDAQKRWQEFTETYGGVDAIIKRERLTAIGLDPSRGGNDATAIARRYGDWIAPLITEYGETVDDGIKVGQLVLSIFAETGYPAPVFVDIIGWGSSPHDILKMAGLKQVFALNGSEGSGLADRSGLLRFSNKRAELYWTIREALDPAYNPTLMLPPSESLYQDLTASRWELRTTGVRIEEKEQVKKRLGRSPDEGEAVLFSLATPPIPQIRNLGDALSQLDI